MYMFLFTFWAGTFVELEIRRKNLSFGTPKPNASGFMIVTRNTQYQETPLFSQHIHRVNSVSLMENITASASLHSPVCNNPDFTIDKKKKKTFNFIFWIIKGITHLCHVIQNKTFISFHNLIQNLVIDSSPFLKYFQLKSVILCKFKKTPINLTFPNPVQELLNLSSSKKILSKIYISLCNVPVSKWYSFKYWILERDVY